MGELDRDADPRHPRPMLRLLDQGCVWLVLDLTDVSHLDYRGVPWLVSQAEEYRLRGRGREARRACPAYLLAILRAAGAHDAFEIYSDAGDAREALSQGHNAWLH
jgi:hypothetical protein